MQTFGRLRSQTHKQLPPGKSSCLLCCFRKQKKTGFCHRPVGDEGMNRKPLSPTNSVNSNLNGNRNCFTLGGKRNCELPPVPVATVPASNTVDGRNVDVIDGTRPYSFCEPSESDPLYASVGLPGASATPRNRPEVVTSTAVAVAANSVVATTKKVDFWNSADSEDSGGSLALPYYSSILHDPNRSSPFYQEAPTIVPSQSPAVYAQVHNPQVPNLVRMRPNVVYAVPGCQASNGVLSGYRRTVKSQGNHEFAPGPPVPSRAYRLSEVEHLLNFHRPSTNQSADCGTDGSNNSHRNERSRRPRSETSFNGLHLLEVLHSGLRRRHNNQPQQQSSSENSSDNRQSMSPALSSVATNTGVVEALIVPRVSGDYGGSTYGSSKSGHYRNITVRESIASLRARNALPTFLSENRRPPTEAQPSDADYEGVYWYPGEGDAGHEAASRSSLDSHVVAEVATDVGSDAYVEIPDRSRKEEIYSEPSENPQPSQTPPLVRNFNVSRILLEMQDFRYVDSETDLSSSVTPPEIVNEGETKETGQVNVNGDEVMQPSTSHKNSTKLRKSDARALPMKAKVRKSQNMTPLMERSMETESARSPPQSPPTHHPEQRPASRPLPEVVKYQF